MNAYDDIKKGERGAWISIAAYLVLSAIKLVSGYSFHSSALIADGFNNVTDIIASSAILVGLKISRKPPDSDHAYGHFRAETVAVMVASFIMATVGIQVLIEAVRGLYKGKRVAPDPLSAGVALFSAAAMFVVYMYNRKLAKKINNQGLMAAAKDSLSDTFVSIGAAIGIFGAQFGLPWLDRVAAIGVGLLICKTAYDIFKDTTHRLTDGFDVQQLNDMRSSISRVEGVEAIKDVKARVHGSLVLVDVVIAVDPMLNVSESHEITDRIEENMANSHNILHVHVHVEPGERIENRDSPF
ncbi:cation diffusion facilitator family transporter [Paenibacillus shirakamiensis]|uniref:Cation diffusion facilitator family transporter n=1 Tax=Paenibacillus shirakamiensis TaxID=1265935 RepID=A0ABS4JMV1_9BACL|nr:cation diffusion facilitator family transporter [Paenibacillus shirakamiensis]MBP2002450.1 cation diffusion facilitator family transporter [Paenibacillus shirakamiensis]